MGGLVTRKSRRARLAGTSIGEVLSGGLRERTMDAFKQKGQGDVADSRVGNYQINRLLLLNWNRQ